MIIKVIGGALLLAFVAFILKDLGWRGAPVFVSVACIMIIGVAAEPLREIVSRANSFSSDTDISESLKVCMKAIGLTYLFGICSEVCTSLGEKGIANAVETVGRVEIIALAMPYFAEVIKIGVELIG